MRDDLATILKDGPPSRLKVFGLSEPVPDKDPDMPPGMTYRLSCLSCGGDRFTFLAFASIVPDPSPYGGLAPDDTLYMPPHLARCVACGQQETVFDVREDGYDAVINQFASYESGEGEPTALPGERRIEVGYLYNNELDDMVADAVEFGVRVADLYDSIDIQAKADDGSADFGQGYELA